MLSFTRKTDYALVALAGLAIQAPAAESAHELASRLNLPLPALRNILKELAHHGLVASTQGSAGGYRLARPADEITLSDVVEAIEGPARLAMCCGGAVDEPDHHCRLEDSCRIKSAIRGIHRRLQSVLDQVTLAEIIANGMDAHTEQITAHGVQVMVRSE